MLSFVALAVIVVSKMIIIMSLRNIIIHSMIYVIFIYYA